MIRPIPLPTVLLVAIGVSSPGAAQVRPAPRPSAPPRPAAAPAEPVGPSRLAAELKKLGYSPRTVGKYQQLSIQEPAYGYTIDLTFSSTNEWLVAMAHLAPIPDLTRVPPAALLNLLHANDSLLGCWFSYSRESAQVMLNAALPARSATPAALREMLARMRATIRQQESTWDAARW